MSLTEKEMNHLPTIDFQGRAVSFRGGYWLFNRDPYFMVYYNPYILLMTEILHHRKSIKPCK